MAHAYFNHKMPPLWALPVSSKLYDLISEIAECGGPTPTITDLCLATRESDYAIRSCLIFLEEGGLIKVHPDERSPKKYRIFEVVKTGKKTTSRLNHLQRHKISFSKRKTCYTQRPDRRTQEGRASV